MPGPSPEPISALTTLVAGLAARARSSALGPIKRGAKAFLVEPWRLERVLPGSAAIPPDALGAAIRRRKDIMRDLGRRGHHAYDANKLLALRQAYLAVRLDRLRRRAALPDATSGPSTTIDLSDDPAVTTALAERARLRNRIRRARARLIEIDVDLQRRLGAAARGAVPGWTIVRESRRPTTAGSRPAGVAVTRTGGDVPRSPDDAARSGQPEHKPQVLHRGA